MTVPPDDPGASVGRRIAEIGRLVGEGRLDELLAAKAELEETHGEALGTDDRLRLVNAEYLCCKNVGRDDLVPAVIERGRALVDGAAPLLRARFLALASQEDWDAHDDDRAIDDIVGALAALEELAGPEPGDPGSSEDLVKALRDVTGACAHGQLFDLAIRVAEQAVVACRSSTYDPSAGNYALAYAHLTYAMRLEHLGLAADAVGHWDSAAAEFPTILADTTLSQVGRAWMRVHWALVAARLHEPVLGRKLLDTVLADTGSAALSPVELQLWHAEGAVLVAEGRTAEARRKLLQVVDEPGGWDHRPWSHDAPFLLGQVAEAAGEAAEAIGWYRTVHEQYGREHYRAWQLRGEAARLEIENRAASLLARADRDLLDPKVRRTVPAPHDGVS